MAQLEVIPVASRRERKQFFDLPWDLYRGDPNWVPPIRLVQKELLNFRRHPFYDDAEIRHFLARIDGKSPVEYLADEARRDTVRRIARALLLQPT